MPVRLVLADDHLVLRQAALKALLERRGLEVVANEADARAAVDAVRRFAPNVAVLDVAMPVSPGASQAIVEAASNPANSTNAQLTPREKQVLTLVGEGKSTKQIADALHISVKTQPHRDGSPRRSPVGAVT